MNLGQAINAEAVQEGRLAAPRQEEKPRLAQGRITLGDRIVAALRGKPPMRANDLFEACGAGNKNSFGVQLSAMRKTGQVVADGTVHSFRYRLPE